MVERYPLLAQYVFFGAPEHPDEQWMQALLAFAGLHPPSLQQIALPGFSDADFTYYEVEERIERGQLTNIPH
jgi:hypothetical protein